MTQTAVITSCAQPDNSPSMRAASARWAAAELLSFVRAMLVRETEEGLALLYKNSMASHCARTRAGDWRAA